MAPGFDAKARLLHYNCCPLKAILLLTKPTIIKPILAQGLQVSWGIEDIMNMLRKRPWQGRSGSAMQSIKSLIFV